MRIKSITIIILACLAVIWTSLSVDDVIIGIGDQQE